MADRPKAVADDAGRNRGDLRQQIAAVLFLRSGSIAGELVEIFRFSGVETLSAEYCRRLGSILVHLLASSVRDGRIDPRGGLVADLRQELLDRSLAVNRLFTFAYLAERTALDELALDDAIGATSEAWPLVAQLTRRASFDVLSGYVERLQLEPGDAPTTDRLTTLHTRAVMEIVLSKEVERAARFGDTLSIILFDVDGLAEINRNHGYGVGDRVLERLGILIRGFFRQHDWVARHVDDQIVVLLTGPDAPHAGDLAESVRSTVQERLEFDDNRTDQKVRVTLSAAVINLRINAGDLVDPERVMADLQAALDRMKTRGKNQIAIVNGSSAAAPSGAKTS
jgi:diguanylate cyclase (GGDEF)-like protein